MITSIETANFIMLPLDKIVSRLSVRRLSPSGIARLQESMRWAGFLENYPLTVIPCEGGYRLIDGDHRYEAAKGLDTISLVPCVIKMGLSESDCYQMAMQCNNAAETVVPSTLVTYAEFIWARLDEVDSDGRKKYTQSDVGRMLGWSRESIKDYAALLSICKEAWEIIGETFDKPYQSPQDQSSPQNGETSPFTAWLLRSILPLAIIDNKGKKVLGWYRTFPFNDEKTGEDYPYQQVELVHTLATDKNFSKGKFKALAEAYDARNQIWDYATNQLYLPDEKLLRKMATEIYNGAYDNEWQAEKEHKKHPKLDKLVASIKEEWQQKNSIQTIHGDFYEKVKKITDGSIDLIVTDPPFNIANEREFDLDGRNNRSQNFGEWDKHDILTEFRSLFFIWATEWKRILRDQGSGYVFCSYRYVSYLRDALIEVGLHVHVMITWHKTNPGPQIMKTTYRSSCEHILFFTKGKGDHTLNWQGENEMHDHIDAPICQGKERLVDAKGEILHPTQKPVSILKHLIQISSNRGDTVFDGFAGTGSSGAAAKELRRKFVGIEKDDTFFAAMQRRLADE